VRELDDKIYTPDEVAQIFQISKHTVYELIKRGELNAFKIGNKMRIEHAELERFKTEQKAPAQRQMAEASKEWGHSTPLRLAGSHDLLVEHLIKIAASGDKPIPIHPTYIGSLEGLMMLYRNQCDIAAVHLLDPASQQYNLPFIHQLFVHERISLVRFASREQGLIVQKGNPKNLFGIEDISGGQLRFVNRQKGSGTRFLLDSLLAKEGISPLSINGYENVEWNHLSTAAHVSRGNADVTFGIKSAADQLGLDFIPVAKEQFDFVFKWTEENEEVLTRFLGLLKNESVKRELCHLTGYDLEELGSVLYDIQRERL
jgi:putative molybdopterin biosynthesis protein